MKWLQGLDDWFYRHELEFYELVRHGNRHEIRLFSIAMLGMILAVLLTLVWVTMTALGHNFPLLLLITLGAGIYGWTVKSFRKNILYTQRGSETHEEWLSRAKKLESGLANIEWLLFGLAAIAFIIRYFKA